MADLFDLSGKTSLVVGGQGRVTNIVSKMAYVRAMPAAVKSRSLKRDNTRLKQVVAELSLQVHMLKKTAIPGLG